MIPLVSAVVDGAGTDGNGTAGNVVVTGSRP